MDPALRSGLAAAWRSDLEGLDDAMSRAGGEARQALSAHRALMLGEPLDPAPVRDPAAAAVAGIARGRAALLAWEPEALRRAAAQIRPSVDFADWAGVMEAWASLLEGTPVRLEESAGGDAALAIEAAVVRGWAELEKGRDGDGLARARRAVRMARSEGLPRQEYLAGVLLARARRVHGKPHHAVCILRSIRSVAPLRWRRTIDWELSFAGGPSSDASAPLTDALTCAREGRRADMESALRRAGAEVASHAPLRLDLAELAEILDPTREPNLCWDFLQGQTDNSRRGVEAAATSGSRSVAFVLVNSGGVRRVLEPGVGLTQATELEGGRSRTLRALCVLALAGAEGLAQEIFFEKVYSFPYRRHHDGALRVLLHRVRAGVAGSARLLRDNGRVALAMDRAFLVEDPRVYRADPLLTLIAANPGRGAREIAQLLGLPRRTVQNQIRTLVEEGICSPQRQGRTISYVVEDTTYSNPTQT